MSKKLFTILLLAVCIATAYSQDSDEAEAPSAEVNDVWTCNHDKIEHPELEYIDVEEEGLKEAQESADGRTLASYPNIRMYGYYGFLSGGSASMTNYLSEKLLPPILSYFESALKVKYPVSGAYKVGSGSFCGHTTPSVLKNGVNADFVYVFASTSASGTWVASTSPCNAASGSRRPLAGITTINTRLFKNPGNDVLLNEKNMIAIMHELTHTLGFSSSLFPNFIDSSGRRLSGHIIKSSLDGASSNILNVPVLTNRLRNHFGCSSLRGGYMENNGPAGAVAGSHWERRQFGFEAMTAYLVYEMQYTEATLALLEASGWYVPNYDMADPFLWGKNKGCNFLTESCSAANNQFNEFCSNSARRCANPRRGGGSCSADVVSDGCRFIQASVEYDCGSSNARNYARLADLQTFGRGTGSKCFEGTLGGSSSTTFCFKYTCSGNLLNIEVGKKTVACTAAGSKTIAGYSGVITCPDPVAFCSEEKNRNCPRGCMGRGVCQNGRCACYNGFKGEDCAL